MVQNDQKAIKTAKIVWFLSPPPYHTHSQAPSPSINTAILIFCTNLWCYFFCTDTDKVPETMDSNCSRTHMIAVIVIQPQDMS